jgi:heme exporter protein D
VSVEHAAVYVAAAYGAILVALIVLYALAARRLAGITRQIRVLREAVERRHAAGDGRAPVSVDPAPAPGAAPAPPPAADRAE